GRAARGPKRRELRDAAEQTIAASHETAGVEVRAVDGAAGAGPLEADVVERAGIAVVARLVVGGGDRRALAGLGDAARDAAGPVVLVVAHDERGEVEDAHAVATGRRAVTAIAVIQGATVRGGLAGAPGATDR